MYSFFYYHYLANQMQIPLLRLQKVLVQSVQYNPKRFWTV